MIKDSHEIYSVGSTKLSCTSWQPETSPVVVVFIVHGLGEHSGRYEEMANSFSENGMASFAFDHRGHGKSEGKLGHAASLEQLIEDTELALMKCRSIFLDIPMVIFGHSMGGQIAASFIKKVKSKELSAAIISSPWLELDKPPPAWQIKLISVIKKILPSLTLSNGLDASHISSMPAEVERYKNDEIVHDQISFALFNALYQNGLKLITEQKRAKVPVLICHGEEDKITSHTASKKYAEHLGEMATFNPWPGSYHEPHHDKNKDEVIQYYADWICNNLSRLHE